MLMINVLIFFPENGKLLIYLYPITFPSHTALNSEKGFMIIIYAFNIHNFISVFSSLSFTQRNSFLLFTVSSFMSSHFFPLFSRLIIGCVRVHTYFFDKRIFIKKFSYEIFVEWSRELQSFMMMFLCEWVSVSAEYWYYDVERVKMFFLLFFKKKVIS